MKEQRRHPTLEKPIERLDGLSTNIEVEILEQERHLKRLELTFDEIRQVEQVIEQARDGKSLEEILPEPLELKMETGERIHEQLVGSSNHAQYEFLERFVDRSSCKRVFIAHFPGETDKFTGVVYYEITPNGLRFDVDYGNDKHGSAIPLAYRLSRKN